MKNDAVARVMAVERCNESHAVPKVTTNLKGKKETRQSLELVALVPPITLRRCDMVRGR